MVGNKAGEPFGEGFKLFDSFNKLMDQKDEELAKIEAERLAEAQRRKEEEQKRAAYREQGLCQYCGGEFKKGFLGIKCTACGKKKDY